jgi:ATP-dependent Clp protease adaptor protein ClpS
MRAPQCSVSHARQAGDARADALGLPRWRAASQKTALVVCSTNDCRGITLLRSARLVLPRGVLILLYPEVLMAKTRDMFESETGVRQKPRLQEPKLYRVVLHNDNYTTMDFVVQVIIIVFHKPAAEATKIMLDVHKKGKGVVGVFTYDIAATKVTQVHEMARQNEYPLKASYEEA